MDDDFLMFEEQMTQTTVVEENCELDCYLEVPRENFTNLNILDWWKVNSAKYSLTSRKACDVLAI